MTDATSTRFAPSGEPVRVWDIWVRLFHWSLVASISTAAVTGFILGAQYIALHIASGLIAMALVAARIVWGFLGPTHARFRDFLRKPAEILSHLTGGDTGRHLGHNPAGGLMMLGLMAVVGLLAHTGLAGLGGAMKTGPFLSLPYAIGEAGLELHEVLALLLLVMILAHVVAAILESRRSHENLARSMVTGIKESRPGDHPSHLARAYPRLALLVIAILAGAIAVSLRQNTHAPAFAPVVELDEIFAEECTACHLAYHPSLLSAVEWREIMGGLDEHFGEDASLDSETNARITEWLISHDASTAQTRPAHQFAGAREDPTGSITETRAWADLHESLSERTFFRAPIYSKSNCSACHADAETGWFSPFQIRISKETPR
ncbi:cytochrome b/b6 domain-containing protein [Tropicimonas sp. TH_r6]|uniref:cytochrome b/b6 domain-containing protein n=1 Tax=Tropicimonas sp. TH_r6 TaxID=3082085 RepID=UPI002955889C|nr:cytochrome b/b6 domain-containing protein [Tropicimonas sp. TH_r6]MDV7145826.1 cytochrome b/b6 domain-containing protein [Tropicimonas sp. TH_r6]